MGGDDLKKDVVRILILTVALAVVAFFWIWLFNATGAKAFWIALISFGVFLAGGADGRKLPWMTLGGVLGVVFGLLTFALAKLVLPYSDAFSMAISGAVFLLVGAALSLGLGSIPKQQKFLEIFPMFLLGWGAFLGAMGRFDFLFNELVVESMPRVITTFLGVMVSVLFGLLFGALLGTTILKLGRKQDDVGEAAPAESIEQGVG
jgi:hypothetical protein